MDRHDVRSVYCDRKHVLWIGTLKGGLYRFAEGKLRHYSMTDGLPDDSIISIIEDRGGRLWMSSDNGIFGFSSRSASAYVRGRGSALPCWRLTPASGLANRGGSGSGQPVASRTADGLLWFADMRGTAGFAPGIVTKGSSPPEVFVESVTADGMMLLDSGDVLRPGAGARRFDFHYTAPDLAAPQSLRFRYRLEPLDGDWVDAGASRVAAYSRLPPGAYHFRVMAGGMDGGWHEAFKPLTLVVVPRVWQTAWFRLLAVVTLVGLIAMGVRMNERRKMRRRLMRIEAQQVLEAERRRIARDLHDDLGSGLAEVVLLGELSRQGNVPPHQLSSHVDTMTEKTRALVTTIDEIVWTVNPRNDSVKSLAAYLSEHMQRFLAPTGVRSRIDIPDTLPDTALSAQLRHNLFLAVKEALHNLVKHSGAKEASLRVNCCAGELALIIEDDGCGFDLDAARGKGNGLESMQSRLATIGARTVFRSRPGHGTTVTFAVPLTENLVDLA